MKCPSYPGSSVSGEPEIVPGEAEIVRLIYRLFMGGMTYSAIAKHLVTQGIPTPGKKASWQMSVVRSILTKKMVKNDGKIQQFYVEDDIKARFLRAFNELTKNRAGLIEDCRLAQRVLCDTTEIDAELADLYSENDVVKALSRKAIFENARTAMNQAEWSQRHDGYVERSRQIMERINELESAKSERLGKSKIIDGFVRDIRKRPLVVTEFDENCGWL